MKFLFVLKDRLYQTNNNTKSYGLSNSAKMVAEYLETIGHECKLVSVIDGNFIDKEVYQYKPDVVIIEALWATGDKMKELMEIPRYKNITWIVRIHSDIGFLSAETRALTFIQEYIDLNKDNLIISCNNKKFNCYLSKICHYHFEYLPNIVTTKFKNIEYKKETDVLKIASFGALRILKNQVFQAMCAIKAADKLGKKLHFHINGDIQNPNNPVLQNMTKLFEINGDHKLYVHGWLDHDEFEETIHRMDLGLQLSYTESFNIVTADFVNEGVNMIVGDSVYWMPWWSKTDTLNYDKLVRKIVRWYKWRNCKIMKKLARRHLLRYNRKAKKAWLRFIWY